jgi:hypothetical protein
MGLVNPGRPSAEQVLEALAGAPCEEGPLRLSEHYLEAIDRLERRPESQPGTDKTWVLETVSRARTLLAGARRLP